MRERRSRKSTLSPEQLNAIKAHRRESEKVNWHWSLTLTIFGIIAGGISTVYYFRYSMLSVWILLGIIVGTGLIALLLQWKYFYSPEFIKKNFRIFPGVFVLYNVGGIGLIVSGLFLTLNYVGASEQEVIEEYRIVGLDRNYLITGVGPTVLLLENDAFSDLPGLRAVDYLEAIHWKEKPIMEVVFYKGLFGINIISGCRLKNVLPEELQKILQEQQQQ